MSDNRMIHLMRANGTSHYAALVARAEASSRDLPGGRRLDLKLVLKQLATHRGWTLNAWAMAAWYEYGQPVVQIADKLAASLLTSPPNKLSVSRFRLPFRSFVMRLPANLLFILNSAGDPESVRSIAVAQVVANPDGHRQLFYQAYTETGVSLWGHGKDTWELLNSHANVDEVMPFDSEVTDLDERNTMLCRRLIVNTCLLMTDPSNYCETGPGHRLFSKRRQRWEKNPTIRSFVLTTKVNHDFRQTVRDYARGTGKKINVQSFVIGHWKSQPYGPKNSKRKTIFVEPYWRGPEDAPIALREHMVSKPRKGPEAA